METAEKELAACEIILSSLYTPLETLQQVISDIPENLRKELKLEFPQKLLPTLRHVLCRMAPFSPEPMFPDSL
jgi:hypothetical protein